MTDLLYRQIEDRIREEISSGQRKYGDRLPSIKQLCTEQQISKSTVLAAYNRLEADGLIAARSRSGYYVTYNKMTLLKTPPPSSPACEPIFASAEQVLVDIMEQGAAFDILPHSANDATNEQLKRCLGRAQRRQSNQEQQYYDEPMGIASLRRQLALRIGYGGGQITHDDVIVTAGCQHALLLALMACTSHGDLVAVESPGFYGVLQLLELQGLQVVELPCSSDIGLSPEALHSALQHWDIKVLVLSPNFSTPTGALMPDANKMSILEIAAQHSLTIIEDDIYGELQFNLHRPRTLFSYDTEGRVILCSSFSKSLSRDLRLGWIVPGKHIKRIKRLKLVTTLSTSITLQKGVSLFLEEGGYDRHLRLIRQQLQQQYRELLHLIPTLLPNTVSCSQPNGGLTLWLELPHYINTLDLYLNARQEGIIIAPGRLFTAQNSYNNFLRLSFSHSWSNSRKTALQKLGQLISSN